MLQAFQHFIPTKINLDVISVQTFVSVPFTEIIGLHVCGLFEQKTKLPVTFWSRSIESWMELE